MITIVGIPYRNYAHYTLYRSCLPIYGIAIVRLLSILFLDGFEGNANISVAIKFGSERLWTAVHHTWEYLGIPSFICQVSSHV